MLDASFSFDGVIGAFAITNDIFRSRWASASARMYIRSLTVYLVRKGTLDDYVYLEHGAHYAIGALAIILLVTIKYEIHEVVTGLVGVVLIARVVLSSSVVTKPPTRGKLRGAGDTGRRSRPGSEPTSRAVTAAPDTAADHEYRHGRPRAAGVTAGGSAGPRGGRHGLESGTFLRRGDAARSSTWGPRHTVT